VCFTEVGTPVGPLLIDLAFAPSWLRGAGVGGTVTVSVVTMVGLSMSLFSQQRRRRQWRRQR
jgi:hypothetical protein